MSEGPRTQTVPVTRASVQRFRLAAGRQTYVSQGDRAIVGTHESTDFALDDPTVSRFHCEVAISAGRPKVRDLGSRNGTFVDGVEVTEAFLKDGSVLTLGRSAVRFSFEGEDVEIPLAARSRFGHLVGKSDPMRALFHVLERTAGSDATVLVTGETGTGKEAVAEALHSESNRAKGPFVVVDCGAIPAGLLESELFGHDRGAFTGADASREGAFQAAEGGTIFLDEIGELSADLQPKLLRVLERREVKPVGRTNLVPVDVRVVAATNRDLRAEVNAGRFRPDLFYRLAVVEVRLPPLRERPDDLGLLIQRLLEQMGPTEPEFLASLLAPEFLERLSAHPWPGNVRELRNYLERCLALREQPPLVASDTPTGPVAADARLPLREERQRWTRLLEKSYLETILRMHDGNVSAAARSAAVDRVQFYRLLWRNGLR